MSDAEAYAVISQLEALYPTNPLARKGGLPPQTRDLWVQALGRWDYSRAVKGLARLAVECRFFPTLAELIGYIEGVTVKPPRPTIPEHYPCEDDLVDPAEVRLVLAGTASKLKGS